jgi:hypothetical protein
MSAASGVRAGRAYVELFADGTRLESGLRQAQAKLRAFSATVNAIGAGLILAGTSIAAPLGLAVKAFTDHGDQLDKMSERTGMSVEALSKLRLAADYSGTSLEQVETAVRKTGQAMEKAFGGDHATIAAFSAIGLSLEELKKQSPDQQFHTIAKAIAAIKEPTDRAYAAMLLYGKSGTQMLPLITSLEESEKRAEQFGATMTKLDATKAADLQDAFTDVKFALEGLANIVAVTLAPALTTAAGIIADTMKAVRDWIDQNRGLAIGLGVTAATLLGIGTACLTLGVAVNVLSYAFAGLSTAVSVATTTVSAFGFVLGALTSPIGLVAAAVAGVGYLILTETTTGQEALGNLGRAFREVGDEAQQAWGGISDALESGNIRAAVKVAWAFIKLEFTAGINAVTNFVQAFATGVAKIFLNIGFSINYAFRWAFTQVMNGLDSLAGYILGVYADLLSKVGGIIKKIGDATQASGLASAMGMGIAASGASAVGQDLVNLGGAARTAVDTTVAQRKASRDRSLDDFGNLWDEKIQSLSDWLTEGMSRRDEKVAQLQAELNDAVAAAGKAKADFDKANKDRAAGAGLAVGEVPLGALVSQLENIKASTSGTFNANAAGGIGFGSSVAERTAKAAEQTSKNTKIIADAIRSQTADTVEP